MSNNDFTSNTPSLTVFADAAYRARNLAAAILTHSIIGDDDSHAACGLCQILIQLQSDLDTLGNDLACAAVEARAANKPMAVRCKP